jgi:VIT1/CCC1 family predicted Fe2+/Mn2+ transporter
VAAGLSFFVLGILRAKITGRFWLRSGLEMVVVGGIAASVAYLVGFLLKIIIS